jgi:signal transduction histidine kinase
MIKFSSLSWQVLLKVMFVHGMVAFLLTISQVWMDYQNQIKSLERQLKNSCDMFGPSLANAFYNADISMTNQIFQGILSQPDFLGIALYDKLADHLTIKSKFSIKYEISKEDLNINQQIVKKKKDGQILYYQQPLYIIDDSKNKQYLGSMIIFPYENIVFENIKSTIWIILINSLIKATVLVLMFLIVFNQLLLQPLQKIKDVVSKINTNNLDSLRLELNMKENNEFVELENNFNKLLDNLYKSQLKISSINKNLDIKVKERTKELELLNDTLEEKIKKAVDDARKKEHFLQQKSKLALMGELITNIAHQWRQPLATLNYIVAILKEKQNNKILKENTLNKKLDEIEDVTLFMSKTIDDFFTYFSPNKSQELINIEEIVEIVLKILKNKLEQEQIEIVRVIQENTEIKVSKQELIHVLLIMFSNSIDAMENNKDKQKIIKIIINQKEYTEIIIEDFGKGIDENNIDRIFEPYFTTKHQSQGIGLGLYICKMIIENNLNGSISVKNINNGVQFHIKIPFNKG